MALPRGGGAPRTITEFAGTLGAAKVGWDGQLHFNVTVGGRVAAFVTPLAGGAGREEAPAPWILVVPLPDGWRVAVKRVSAQVAELHLVRPGAPLDDPGARVLVTPDYSIAPDGRAIAYVSGTQIRRHTLATGEDALVRAHPLDTAFAPSPDGKTLYVVEALASAPPQLITNFASRPHLD